MSNIDTNEEDYKKWTGRVVGGTRAGNFTQTRFQRIPDSHLNIETVAGIRDMNLGRIKNGQPVGAPTIRFDTGANTGANPHINIDPRGRPSAQNPHIEVPAGLVDTAKVVSTTLKYAGITLTVAAVVIDSWRIISAIKDDIYISEHADEIIEELENSIQKLKKSLKAETSSVERENFRKTIEHLQNVLRDVKRTKKVPVKSIKTASSIGGGWGGGIAGGYAGAWAGAQTGALIGTAFGPAGAAVGAPIGAVLGAIGLGIGGGIAGSVGGEALADKGLELAD